MVKDEKCFPSLSKGHKNTCPVFGPRTPYINRHLLVYFKALLGKTQ